MQCPNCNGFMEQYFLDCMRCLRCGNKELASNSEKNN